MHRGSKDLQERPVIISLANTSKFTLKMLAELWYVLWHEVHR